MRIVAVSDTHNVASHLTIPDGDVLVHAGDSTYNGKVQEIVAFNAWLGTLPHRHKIIISGNHDWLFQRDLGLARGLMTNAIYLGDSGVKLNGVQFWGSPWQPWFYDWAFNAQRGGDIKRYWDLIPTDTQVLITHGPPMGIRDQCRRDERVGCEELHDAVFRIKPKVHIFGHIHEGYGVEEHDGIRFVNASSCDENYKPVNEPIIIDL